jgi:multidrug resistance protein, MATE family
MSDPQSFRAHAKGLIALAVPMAGTHLAQMLLHVTDTVMLGWYGIEALAAVVLATSFFFFMFILGSGVGTGIMGLIASARAQGDETQVRRVTRMGIWLSVAYGLLVIPPLVWSGPVLVALGQKPELAAMAQDYLRIAFVGMIPALLVIVLRSYFAALERASVVLWVTLAGVVLNACLNWMLIFGNWGAPELGLRGSAIATAATQVLQIVLLIAVAQVLPASRPYHLFRRFWRPDWAVFGQVMRLGLPAGLTLMAESGLFIAAALMMGWVGTVELAAHGIALQMASLAFMIYLGLSNAVTVKVGRAHGAGDDRGMRAVGLAAVILTFLICAVIASGFVIAPRALLGLFLDERQANVASILTFGSTLLGMAALFQIFDAMQVIALGLLRGVQDARVPMWIAAVSYWVIGIPLSYLFAFPLGWGGIGVWGGLVVGLAFASGLLMLRFWRGTWVGGTTQSAPA